jgi:hypothetical protein
MMVAMPNVSTELQRDHEEELIFRGESIARAIRAYKATTGSYPLNLEDLTKIRPRIIRKLYLDPMTWENGHEGEWELITAVQPGASGDKTGLPIVGVHSTCEKDSIKTYKNKTLISDWNFSAADNLLGIPGGDAAAAVLGATGTSVPGLTTQTTTAKPVEGVDPASLPQGVQTPTSQNSPVRPAQPVPVTPAPPTNQPSGQETPDPGAGTSPTTGQGVTDSAGASPGATGQEAPAQAPATRPTGQAPATPTPGTPSN